MKNLFKTLIIKILFWESRLILNKFQPKIIAITGNVGKTTTKEYVGQILTYKYPGKVRFPLKSLNSEIGVTLTILNQDNAWSSFFKWIKVVTIGFLKQFFGEFPEILVLEIGADHPGDIKKLSELIKPDIVVLTAFQDLPTHAEFFRSKEEHVREKKYLFDALKTNGVVIYNSDDRVMTDMVGTRDDVKKYSFGKGEFANVQIKEVTNHYDNESILKGLKIKIKKNFENKKEEFDVYLEGILGEAQNYSLAAGVGVASTLNIEIEEIVNAMREFLPANSRMRLLNGIYGSILVDDSYNASPIAFENAFEAISKIFVKGKKVFVLGHMAELGKNTELLAHKEVAKSAAEIANVIILSGRHNEYYLEGLKETDFPEEKIYITENAQEVIDVIYKNDLIDKNNLLFVKGSQSARLEKVVVEFLMDKRDSVYVCRQDTEWKKI